MHRVKGLVSFTLFNAYGQKTIWREIIMTREFFAKVLKAGIVETRRHIYRRIAAGNLIKIIRDDGIVCAVYAA